MSVPLGLARLSARLVLAIVMQSVIRVVVAATVTVEAVAWFAVPIMFAIAARSRGSV
jgi:hypothetical protein